jgi:hypothetical protein
MVLVYGYKVLNIFKIKIIDKIPHQVIDTLRGSCVLVALAVLFYYFMFGLQSPMNFYRGILNSHSISIIEAFLIEFFVHFLPVLMIGLPQSGWSYVFAYISMLVWYIIIRHKASSIYGPDLGHILGKMILIYAPIAVSVLYVLHAWLKIDSEHQIKL